MSVEQENIRRDDDKKTSQNQQNNGNIGREVESEKDPNNDSYVIDNQENEEKPNERGIAENETDHWSGNYGQQSSNRPNSGTENNPADDNDTEKYPKKGYNHVDNPGGTAEEDLHERKNSINLRNDDDDTDPQDADASRL